MGTRGVVILLQDLWRDGAAVAGIRIPQACSLWICVAGLNMHAGVTECHQCGDVCALSRPRDRATVNLGETHHGSSERPEGPSPEYAV